MPFCILSLTGFSSKFNPGIFFILFIAINHKEVWIQDFINQQVQTRSYSGSRYSWFIFFLLIIIPFSKIASQKAGEWPCFHGSDRTNLSDETGLLKAWDEKGPALLFTISGLGEGYSSTAIAGGLIYTAGSTGNQSFLYAFDLNGKLVWKKPNGAAWSVTVSWASSYNGPRSTPTIDNGVVYHLSEAGRLAAFRAKTGDVIWSRDLPKDFNAKMPMYGYAESDTYRR